MNIFSAEKIWKYEILMDFTGVFAVLQIPMTPSVGNPKRSFCPNCKYQIPFYHNIPLLSWLLLRGKCANCGKTISPRYFFVELLTAFAFLLV